MLFKYLPYTCFTKFPHNDRHTKMIEDILYFSYSHIPRLVLPSSEDQKVSKEDMGMFLVLSASIF